MRRLLTTTTAMLALAAPLLGSPPAHAAGTIDIKPGKLARGADIKGAHLEGTTIVDGDTSVQVKRPNVRLYGKWHDYYIAATGNKLWGNVKLVRIKKNGNVKVLREFIDPFETVLDAESDQIAYSYGDSTQKPTLAVYDLGLKQEVTVHGFAKLPTLLDFRDGLAVASFWDGKVKTITWNTVTDDVVRVKSKMANYASVDHDLIGYYSKDPYQGGCQVLGKLRHPNRVVWRSCDERIEAVSPDGKRLATIPLLSDGLGSSDIWLRKVNGVRLAHYTIGYFFGAIWWETPTKLLMDANGKHQAATVRCKVAVCDRASDLREPAEF